MSLALFSAQKPSGLQQWDVACPPHPGDLLQETHHSPFHQGHRHGFFDHHIQGFLSTVGIAASERVSRAAPWGQQGLSHLCFLQPSQQRTPGFPRDSHHNVLVPLLPGSAGVPTGWSREQSCSPCCSKVVQGPGPPGYEQDGVQTPLVSAAGPLVRRRLRVRLPSAAEGAGADGFFLLPGSYLISVQVCREKPHWDL